MGGAPPPPRPPGLLGMLLGLLILVETVVGTVAAVGALWPLTQEYGPLSSLGVLVVGALVPWVAGALSARRARRAHATRAGQRLVRLLMSSALHTAIVVPALPRSGVDVVDLPASFLNAASTAVITMQGNHPGTTTPHSFGPGITFSEGAGDPVKPGEGLLPALHTHHDGGTDTVVDVPQGVGGYMHLEVHDSEGGSARRKPGFRYPPRARGHAPSAGTPACAAGAHLVKGRTAQGGGNWHYCVDKAGMMHGPSVQWHSTGKLRESGHFLAGLKNGTFERYDAAGELLERGAFKDDEREGPWEEWRDDLRVEADRNGSTFRSLEEGPYKRGLRDGTWTSWAERCAAERPDLLCTQVKRQETYVAGARHGPATEWFENGSIAAQGQYKHGQPDGAFTIFHADATAHWRQHFAGGLASGTWQRFCPNGRLVQRESYDEQGRRTGPYHAWTEGGRVLQEGAFAEGAMHGTWITHEQDGPVRAEYQKGVAVVGRAQPLPGSCNGPDRTLAGLVERRRPTP